MPSSAFALGTIPIPQSTGVPYTTPTLGTDNTCFVQGFMMYIGGSGLIDTTLCLAWYYVYKILRTSNWTIVTRIYEPIFYVYIVADNVISFSLFLQHSSSITIYPWSAYCFFSPIPSSCWIPSEKAMED